MEEKIIIISARLIHDDEFCVMCLQKLYARQTEDEQETSTTHHVNGRGFTKADGTQLSIWAQFVKDGGVLERFEMLKLRPYMPKYAGQLATILTNKEIES